MSTETNRLNPGEMTREVNIPAGSVSLHGNLTVPDDSHALVIFAHGSGSSRHSPRNQLIARHLRRGGFGTLLFDMLTPSEEATDSLGNHLRFNMGLLTQRLVSAAHWLAGEDEARHLPIGFFGSNTGGGAALVAAADLGNEVGAVVVRGGRVDLAGGALRRVKCPTLLIVGEHDEPVREFNEETCELLTCEKELAVVAGAGHLFEEPGALDEVARLGVAWFDAHLHAYFGGRIRHHDLGSHS
jgi:putative phosphoribosyl transferase